MKSKGIVIAADKHAAWLLPWWWKCYSRHNTYPVVLINLGLPEETLQEWSKYMQVLSPSLPHSFVFPPEQVDDRLQREWEDLYGPTLWKARPAWFLKPFVMLHSPFDLSVWIDLDCEILRPLDPLFNELGEEQEIGMALETETPLMFNSGVVLYKKTSRLLVAWANSCLTKNHLFIGDQQLFTHLLNRKKKEFKEIDPSYNWLAGKGFCKDVFIHHWTTQGGKIFIEMFGGIQGYIEAIYALDLLHN